MPDVLIRATGVTKSFGGIHALRDVDVEIGRGEVHGLIGPNGSGKSTLMKIFAGMYRPDRGEVTVGGTPLRSGVADSRKQGITIVPQEITLVPTLSVEDNVVLGADPARWGLRSARAVRQATERVLVEVGCDVDPGVLVRDVIPTQRRLVMIAAALQRGAEALILDEPTAGLANEETRHVTDAIRQLKASGRTVIFVSHHLDELIELSDRITVLREGQVVGRFLERKAERAELIRLISPTDQAATPESEPAVAAPRAALPATEAATPGETRLWVEQVASGALHGLDFEVRRGECVGVIGGVGSGLRELAETLSGMTPVSGGRIRTRGVDRIGSPHDALRGGVLFISGERHRFVIKGRSVGFQVCLPSLPGRARGGFVSGARELAAAQQALASVGVSAEPSQPLSSLSGGNQQRALFARAALGHVEVVAVYEPSVGVDVHGRELLREHMRSLRVDHAVVVLSSDPEELAGLCDKVICLRGGEASAVLHDDEVTIGAMFDAIS